MNGRVAHGFFYDMELDVGEKNSRRPVYSPDDVWQMMLLRPTLNYDFRFPAFLDEVVEQEMFTAMREHGLIENGEDGLALIRFVITVSSTHNSMRDTETWIDCDTRLSVAGIVSIYYES